MTDTNEFPDLPEVDTSPVQVSEVAVASSGDPEVNTSPETEVKEEAPSRARREPSTVVTQKYAHSRPLGAGSKVDTVTLVLPSDTAEQMKKSLENLTPDDIEPRKEFEEKMEVIDEGEAIRPDNDMFARTVVREGSMWTQGIDGPAGELSAAKPSIRDREDEKLTGRRAVQRVMSYLGQGGGLHFPLWHSGFWITIDTPSDAELLDLERKIADDKILLGRVSNGRVFSNTSVFIAGHVKKLLIDKMYDSSLKDIGLVEGLIDTSDLQHVAWGLACSVWPSGFEYARTLMGDGDKPMRTVRELLNVTKLQWVDRRSLTDWQINHMARRQSGSMTRDDIEKYQKEFKTSERLVQLAENVAVILGKPTMNEYINSGHQWVNNIVIQNDRTFGMDQDEKTRNDHIISHSRATAVRQYGHWVKAVVLGNNVANPITMEADRDTVESILDKISSSDEARTKFFEEVPKFIEDTTIAVIAVPTVDAVEENKYPAWPHLVPIDSLTTFFTLLTQKTQQIRARV